jgi:glycosyltransferase involved in cell wall biosynthesis
MNNLTLVIPAKNEKLSLPQVLNELKKFNIKSIIVVHPSDEETIKATKIFQDCEIILQDGKGYGDALIKGINSVNTELFSIFNADGSFNPNEIEEMLKKISKDELDILFASRYEKNGGSDDDTFLTLIGNKIFTLLGKLFFKLKITDILYTFVIGNTKKVKELNLESKDFGFCVELPIKAIRNNLKISSIASMERKRIAGKKNVNEFKDGFLILFKMLILFFKK